MKCLPPSWWLKPWKKKKIPEEILPRVCPVAVWTYANDHVWIHTFKNISSISPSFWESYLHAFGPRPVQLFLEAARFATSRTQALERQRKEEFSHPAWKKLLPSDSDLVGKRQPGHCAGGLHRGTDVMIARGLSERLAGARFLALLTSCHSSALHTYSGHGGAWQARSDSGRV